MDTLQIALLLTGIAIIAGIYLFSFRRGARTRSRQPDLRADADASLTAAVEGIEVPNRTAAVPAEDLAAIGSMIAGDIRAQPGAATADPAGAARPAGAISRTPRRAPQQAPEFILQLLIVGRDGRKFRGPDVVNALTKSGLVLGDMNIFHCTAPGDDRDQPLFSVANLLEPGSFNMNFIDHFETPGLVLFMTLPGPADGKSAFNRMLGTARQLATALNGDIRDETRSVLTPQGVERVLEQITEFQRKRHVESRRSAHA